MTDLPAPTPAGWPGAAAPVAARGPSLLDRLWPDEGSTARPAVLAAAASAGLLSALVIPEIDHHGVGLFLVLGAVAGVAAASAWHRRTPYLIATGGLCLALLSTLVLRDATWIVALCVLAAGGLGSVALGGGRSAAGIVFSAASVPLAALRGLPWLRRGIGSAAGKRRAAVWPVVRTAAVSAGLVLLFGALLSSADALFAQWMDTVVPDLPSTDLPQRFVLFTALTGLALAGAYVGQVAPNADRLTPPALRPVRRAEWAVPVALVDLLLVVFLAAQLTALFGGHAYLRRTTGLTYAEYVHQGFGQLTAVTLLTLLVVGGAAAVAPRGSDADRRLMRVLLGLLCALTLVVVASALHRMNVYEQAYGFTRMRVLVTAFEAWLGLLVAFVMVTGLRLKGGRLPRAAVFSGSSVLLLLALLNPDAYIAERNIDRFEETGKIDWVYLSELSGDAVPALARLPEPYRSCAVAAVSDPGVLDWNLGRARGHAALVSGPAAPTDACRSLPAG